MNSCDCVQSEVRLLGRNKKKKKKRKKNGGSNKKVEVQEEGGSSSSTSPVVTQDISVKEKVEGNNEARLTRQSLAILST